MLIRKAKLSKKVRSMGVCNSSHAPLILFDAVEEIATVRTKLLDFCKTIQPRALFGCTGFSHSEIKAGSSRG